MTAKSIKVGVLLPRELIEQLAAIANMAHVPLESVLKVALVMYVMRHVPPMPPND